MDLCCTVCFVHYSTFGYITNHSATHHLFADNTQLQKSAPSSDVQSLTRDVQPCTDDIKAWMCNNQLKLNDKNWSHSLLNTFSVLLSLLTMISHGWYTQNCVFKQSGTWGLSLTSKWSDTQSSICRYLTENSAKQLVTSCVLSRLGYCNSLVMGTPSSVNEPI